MEATREQAARHLTKSTVEESTVAHMIDVLMRDGFNDAPPKIIKLLAELVIKSTRSGRLNLRDEYAAFAVREGIGGAAVRSQLTYYIDKNKASMRESIESKGIQSDEEFLSNKRFVRLLGGVYYADCMQNNHNDDTEK